MKRWIPFLKSAPTVAVLRLSGVIGSSGRGALNDQGLAPLIEKAFKKGKPAAVALQINSPGGSPVQSSLIGARIRRLAEEKDIPVIAFVEDVAASGGYWLATAADEIYADRSSIVGSIGVIAAGFGVNELMSKHGVERRVYTAGKSKSMLDMFSPEKPEDVERFKGILEQSHQNFIGQVKDRRGDKLDASTDLFTGEFWLADQALEYGLIDGIGHIVPEIKTRFGEDVRFRRYEAKRPMWQRFSTSLAHEALTSVEERAQFARFGL